MVHLKTSEEIQIMKECGKKLMQALDELIPMIKPGITTLKIDEEAERLIEKYGAKSSFKRVQGYSWTTCLPINEQVVHTPPGSRVVKDGDVLTLDIGAFYKGFHTDYATTIIVGSKKDPKVEAFLETGKKTLDKALEVAQKARYIGEISKIIEEEIYGHGYFILKDLTGHGIGHELHEDPYVPNFLDRPVEKTFKIKEGLVIAVEVIYSMGTEEIAYEKKGEWSIRSKDNSLCGCFEKTIAFEDENRCILT